VINLTDTASAHPHLEERFSPSNAHVRRLTAMPLDAAPAPPASDGTLSPRLHEKLQAAMILRGLISLVLEQGPVEVQPRTWYRERGTDYLEIRHHSSGERAVIRLDSVRDVRAY
jgi:hypothetical protein